MKTKIWLGFSCLILLGGFSSISCRKEEPIISKEIDPVRPVTPELIEEIITKEVPQNANKDHVLDFLKKHRIDNTGYKKFRGGLQHGAEKRINRNDVKFIIFAYTQPRIRIIFYFDKNDQLLGHCVYKVGSVDELWP